MNASEVITDLRCPYRRGSELLPVCVLGNLAVREGKLAAAREARKALRKAS